MSRDLSAGVVAEVTGPRVRMAWLCWFNFGGGPVFAWTGTGPLTWNGDVYVGTGMLGDVEVASEIKNGLSSGATFSLVGLDPAMLALALTEDYSKRKCWARLAFFTEAGVLIPDPVCLFAGRMSVMTPTKDPKGGSITLEAERGDYDPRPWGALQSNVDQQRRWPGDRGMEYAARLNEARMAWGNTKAVPATLRASSIVDG